MSWLASGALMLAPIAIMPLGGHAQAPAQTSAVATTARTIPSGPLGRGFRRIALPAGAKPDPIAGKAAYAQKCAGCHGAEGEGLKGADGACTFPPVWRDKSFNIGAGMARLENAAAFIKVAMPPGQGNTLTDKEAFDIAAYVVAQPRPEFAAKAKDWPKGGKPADSPY